MVKNKIWKIKGYEDSFSDEEIVSLIRKGEVKADYALSTREMKTWVRVRDSIYQYYLPKGDDDETI